MRGVPKHWMDSAFSAGPAARALGSATLHLLVLLAAGSLRLGVLLAFRGEQLPDRKLFLQEMGRTAIFAS